MKKYILGAAILLSSSPAFAETNPTTNLTGAYVGVYGGHNWTDVDIAGGNLDVNDWENGLFVGYRIDKVLDWTQGYVFGGNAAIEGFYSLSGASGSGIEKDNEWGVSFRPGLSILDSVTSEVGVNPYMILGYRNTELEGVVSDSFHGFELGVGTQLVAFGNAGMRLDYSHTWYNSRSGIDPSSDDLRLGLSYHF